jgi:CcmD family protein
MNTLYYLFAAYSATWMVLLLYLFLVWKKQERIEKDLQQLKKRIQLN